MKKIISLILFLFSTTIFANQQYRVVIDAGDEASRLHIFKFEEKKPLPDIKEIFTEEVSPPLYTFANAPEKAGESLKKLLDDAKEKLSGQSSEIYVMGTNKMRALPIEKQAAIYANITGYIKSNYDFKLNKVETLSGKMLGVYLWLSANYLAQHFQQTNVVSGVVNVSNTSTEIAFPVKELSQSDDEVKLQFNDQYYVIFSKSFPSLGLENVRDELNKTDMANACYPFEFPFSESIKGNFKLSICRNIYTNVIQKHIPQFLPAYENLRFIAAGKAYRVYGDFLGAADPDQLSYLSRLDLVCSANWDSLRQEYDNFSETELANLCANAVFFNQFFYDALKLKGSDLWVADKIDRQTIDWPLGLLLLN
ncbi:MAG: hypothetical protein ACYCQI_07640 [Gammaproteobacteria bacterium]